MEDIYIHFIHWTSASIVNKFQRSKLHEIGGNSLYFFNARRYSNERQRPLYVQISTTFILKFSLVVIVSLSLEYVISFQSYSNTLVNDQKSIL